jgi:superfamily II DNA or RNA helicase
VEDQGNWKTDIAVIQSLIRKGEVKNILTEYSQVIVDECHHFSAFSFERVLNEQDSFRLTFLAAMKLTIPQTDPL